MRLIQLAAVLAVATAPVAAFAQAAPAADHYSSATTPIGTLLDDPAAKAVLVKYIPDTVNNPQIDMARGMTLKDTQAYAPDSLTDAVLAKIDADLAKLPPAKP
jgi:hypothetical protein